MALTWRVHSTLPRSLANGPGERFTIWSQGCALACPGCFNPETHTPEGPNQTVSELVDQVLAETPGIEGVTLTGGEPLEQPEPIAAFCTEIKTRTDLGIIVLTGFTRPEIEADPARTAAVAAADLVVAGRYNQRLKVAASLRGSTNKTYWHRTARYRQDDLGPVPDMEIIIDPDGTVTATGMTAPGKDVW